MKKITLIMVFTLALVITGCTDTKDSMFVENTNNLKSVSDEIFSENTLEKIPENTTKNNEINTNDEEMINNDYIYVNKVLGYSVKFPNMKNRVLVTENDGDTVNIYSTRINNYLKEERSDSDDNEYKNNLNAIAEIYLVSKSKYPTKKDLEDYITNDTPVPTFYLGETKDNFICYVTASDAIYPLEDKLKDEYNEIVSILEDNSNFKDLNN